MTSGPLPNHLPRYCMFCGSSLTYTEIREGAGGGSASWNCTGCGKEDTDNWSEFDFTPIDQTDQSSTDQELEPFSPDYLFSLPPPPPPQPPLTGLTTPPSPSCFDNSEDERIIHEQFEKEFLEHQKQYEALHRQSDADGIAAIVRAAHFPLFALSDIQGRFPFLSHGLGWSGLSAGKTQYRLSSFSLGYEGPNYPNVTERIAINQEDKEENLGSHLMGDDSQIFATGRIIHFLTNLCGSEEPDMLALWQGMAIYQYVNIEAASRTPVIRASIQAQSGEVVSWKIWRFNAPLPIVYARAQIENTIIDVGAIGPVAEEIEELLGQLTRLTPESVVVDQLNLGARAFAKHLQRYYQTLIGSKFAEE